MRRALASVATLLPMTASAAEGSGIDTGALLRLTLGLGAVLALIVALAWMLRRMGRFSSTTGQCLYVLGAVSVGQRERVVLLQAGQQQLLLGVAPGSVRTLQVLGEPLVSTTETTPETGNFAARLRGAMGERAAS